MPRGDTILATVTGFRVLTDREITGLENRIRETLENDNINLIIRTIKTNVSDHNGEMLYGWMYHEDIDDITEGELLKLDGIVKAKFKKYPKLFLMNAHKSVRGGDMNVLVEGL